MPPQPLPEIPNRSNLFIDANILVYAIEGRSVECRNLLERCSREEITGICSYTVAIEATYQFMIAEARKKRLLPEKGVSPGRYLKENPNIVMDLRDYWIDVERIFALNLLLLESEESTLRQAQLERERAGLLPMDSVIVSCMRQYGIPMLATNDNDFSRVVGIQVFQPTDL